MPVPQQITDALTAVQQDADALADARAADKTADAALAKAQADKTGTAAAVVAARAHLVTDLQALVALEQQTYGAE